MKQLLQRLFGDERGTSFEGIALSVSIIAVGFVASADVLDYVTKKHGEAIGSSMREVASAVLPTRPDPGIDYMPTGSTARPIILDPCTGRQK